MFCHTLHRATTPGPNSPIPMVRIAPTHGAIRTTLQHTHKAPAILIFPTNVFIKGNNIPLID